MLPLCALVSSELLVITTAHVRVVESLVPVELVLVELDGLGLRSEPSVALHFTFKEAHLLVCVLFFILAVIIIIVVRKLMLVIAVNFTLLFVASFQLSGQRAQNCIVCDCARLCQGLRQVQTVLDLRLAANSFMAVWLELLTSPVAG